MDPSLFVVDLDLLTNESDRTVCNVCVTMAHIVNLGSSTNMLLCCQMAMDILFDSSQTFLPFVGFRLGNDEPRWDWLYPQGPFYWLQYVSELVDQGRYSTASLGKSRRTFWTTFRRSWRRSWYFLKEVSVWRLWQDLHQSLEQEDSQRSHASKCHIHLCLWEGLPISSQLDYAQERLSCVYPDVCYLRKHLRSFSRALASQCFQSGQLFVFLIDNFVLKFDTSDYDFKWFICVSNVDIASK